MAKATMREIARRVGVSPTTVAHVLNDTPGAQVAEKTRRKVLQAAERIGYQKSLLARSIKSPLRQLGVAVSAVEREQPQQTDAWELFEGIRSEACQRSYSPVIQPMPTRLGQTDSTEAVERMAELHRAKLVDGFIIDKQAFTTTSISDLYSKRIPLVMVNGSPVVEGPDGNLVPAVVVDNSEGGRLAIQHLLELGHERIGVITRPFRRFKVCYRPYPVGQLIEGCRKAASEAGLPMRALTILDGDPFDRGRTHRAVDKLLSQDPRPTALFVGDDAMAVLAMQRLAFAGLRVPWDVSVIGYGDWALPVRLSEPALTTIRTPLRENGRIAAMTLIRLVEAGTAEPVQAFLTPELIIRKSTARRRD
jgi:DNA-binding LacI/PurR family transcriptional regulator